MMKRTYAPWDPFFDLGNLERELWVKRASYEAIKEASTCGEEIACGIDGCKTVFPSMFAFETHYASAHLHKCSACGRAMPSCRLLSLHIMEAHDSFFVEMAKRESMYECLVEGCLKKFKGDFQRERHLIDAHKFPKHCHFMFHPTRTSRPSEKRGKTKERSKRKSKRGGEGDVSTDSMMEDGGEGGNARQSPQRPRGGGGRGGRGGRRGRGGRSGGGGLMDHDAEGGGGGGDVDMDDLCDSMRQLKTPTTIRFGRGSASAFRSGRGQEKGPPEQ